METYAYDAGSQAFGTMLESIGPEIVAQLKTSIPRDLKAKCDVSDLVQETLLATHQDFAQFQGHTKQELLNWLRGVLKNQLNNLVRRYRLTGKRQVGREESLEQEKLSEACDREPAAATPEPSAAAIEHEELILASQALDRLSERDREVISLVCGEALTFTEIGKRLRICKGTARQRYLRALERFRDML